jgi:sugar diacid utilization regulator
VVSGTDVSDPAGFVHSRLRQSGRHDRWQVAAGRPYPGAYGIARSYEEAREALLLARRLHFDDDVVQARDLLLFRVLGRDQAALVDLVQALLEPLTRSRGGAEPLLKTLETYFATGAVATETARRLHMSVRTVTYRLAKVKTLTGTDPADPAQRLALHMAVVGARLLDWPASDLPRQSLS